MTRKDAPKAPVLILGARSDVGRALAHEYGRAGYPLYLAARQAERLRGDTADLSVRYGVKASLYEFDVLAFNAHADFVRSLPILPEIVICVVGLMTDQKAAEKDFAAAQAIMLTNYVGPASILGEFANAMEQRGFGTLVGISSVAGDRGRATNYVYGSAKAGFAAFLSGLRNRLAKKGVHVITAKLGFVDTRMIEGMETPKALTARPEEVSEAVYRAWQRGRDVIYVRPVWCAIMASICAIPEAIFKRMAI